MTSLSPTPVPVDDSDLLRMAVAPRGQLFPTLNRASAFAPLIMVCCVLPAFQMLTKPTLNEEISMWGLRGLAVSNSTNFVEFLEPGLTESVQPLIYQPPLSAWLNGLVIRILEPTHPLAASFVSLVCVGIAIWLATRLAWRMGGANTALVSGLLMCSHPQVLEMAIAPSGTPIGFLLMLASIFGLQRHFESKSARTVSSSLILSGITWGLSLLAVGPIAFSVPLLFAIHSLNQRIEKTSETGSDSTADRMTNGWPALRSTLILLAIGSVVGGWWEVYMFSRHGLNFWRSWWASLPVECLAPSDNERQCELRSLLQPSWADWLTQQALLIGWIIVGLERSWHVSCRPSSERVRRRYQLLMLWWGLTFVARVLAAVAGLYYFVNTSVWNMALLAPSVLLAALGIATLIERAVSRRGEFFLVVLLVSLTAFRMCLSWFAGMIGGALAATILICGPRFISSTGRNENGWTEASWRQMLQLTVYGSLVACLWMGLSQRRSGSGDEDPLADLRDRLSGFPQVRRISLMATRDSIPVKLRYLLQSRWPSAEIVTSEGWDAGLTQAMNEESQSPHSHFLILESTRRDLRMAVDTGQGWQVKTVGNPMRINGQRLTMALIGPRT